MLSVRQQCKDPRLTTAAWLPILNQMDSPFSPGPTAPEAHAVLAHVTCSWGSVSERATAVIVHAARDMLVLEGDRGGRLSLPPLGTEMHVFGERQNFRGRLAEHGRGGRFLVSIGTRPVRRAMRLRVSLPGTMRCAALMSPLAVEIIDLTTGGCRLRGIELAVGTQVALEFTPPGRTDPVSVRALVVHSTFRAQQPWIGLAFRLVALRGGR